MDDEVFGIPMLGEKIPSFETLTTHGKMKFPESMDGSWWIMFSHPADILNVATFRTEIHSHLYN